MIPQTFEYSSPSSLADALGLLSNGAKPLAGGHSLIPMMKLRLAVPEHLVDLHRIPGLAEIREEGGKIHIGAMVTHHQIEASGVLKAKCPLLPETAANIGDVQVRNRGTLGGSIAHADPAADWPAALQALEAEIKLASADGERIVPASEFFIDTFTTAVEPGELVTEVIVPVEASATGSAYQKMFQPASGFAIVGVAARVTKANGRITAAHIGVTGLSPSSFRATAAEKLLIGTEGAEEDIRKAAAAIPEGQEANSDLHASANYRKEMAKVFGARALRAACQRSA